MQLVLNIFRTKLVSNLQQKYVGIYIQNSELSNKSAAHYNDKMFPDDKFLYATINDGSHCTLCNPIKPRNIIHIKLDLGFVVNIISTLFLLKNYIMDQMIH